MSYFGTKTDNTSLAVAGWANEVEARIVAAEAADFYATPASYVIYKYGATYYAKPCFSGGTSYNDASLAVVERAANAALASGGKILLRLEGSHDCLNDLQVGTGVGLQGLGQFTTMLKNVRTTAQGATSGLIENGNMGVGSNTDITVCDLGIDGDRLNNHYGFGIAFEDTTRTAIRNVYLKNVDADAINFNGLSVGQGGSGQAVDSSSQVWIENVLQSDSGVDCIALNNVSDFHINNVTSVSPGTRTVGINGHHLTITKNTLRGEVTNFIGRDITGGENTPPNTGGIGIMFNGGTDISFNNLWLYHNSGSGVFTNVGGTGVTPSRLNFSNVHIYENKWHGMHLRQATYVTVNGGFIVNSGHGSGGTSYDAIYLDQAPSDMEISHLLCTDNQGTKTQNYAVRGSGSEARIQIGQCNFIGNNQANPISLSGTCSWDEVLMA